MEPVSRRGFSPQPALPNDSQDSEQGSPTRASISKRERAQTELTFTGRPPKRSRSFAVETPRTSPGLAADAISPAPTGGQFKSDETGLSFFLPAPLTGHQLEAQWPAADADFLRELMSGAQCDDDEPLPLEADHANAEWASEDLQKLQFLLAELTPSDLAEPLRVNNQRPTARMAWPATHRRRRRPSPISTRHCAWWVASLASSGQRMKSNS